MILQSYRTNIRVTFVFEIYDEKTLQIIVNRGDLVAFKFIDIKDFNFDILKIKLEIFDFVHKKFRHYDP